MCGTACRWRGRCLSTRYSFSVPADKKLVIGMVEEARVAGIDVRVVPDLYDGLAWNAQVEYIGQFPTIPLHRQDFPIGGDSGEAGAGHYGFVGGACAGGAPVMLVIAIAIRMDSEGRSFYKAQRIGRKGRAFHVLQVPDDGAQRGQAEGGAGAHE